MTKPRSDDPPFKPEPKHGSVKYVTYGEPGRWLLRVGTGYDKATGKYGSEETTIGPLNEKGKPLTRHDVERICETFALKTRESRKERPASAITFGEVLDAHMERLVKRGLAPKTEVDYRRYIRVWIKPMLGKRKFKDLTPEDFAALYEAMGQPGANKRSNTTKGLSSSAIRQAHAVCSGACKTGMLKSWLTWNPAAAAIVVLPARKTTKDVEAPLLDHVQEVLDECGNDPNMPMLVEIVQTAMAAGLREGECCGLRWRNLNEETLYFKLDNNITEHNTGRQQDDPEYQKSYATHTWGDAPMKGRSLDDVAKVAIPGILVAALQTHREIMEERARWAGTKITDNSYIFSFAADGMEPLRPARVGDRWREAAKRAGHPKIRFHDLRHLYGTTLFAKDVDISAIKEQMRHGQVSTTMAFYIHMKDAESQRKVADAIEDEYADVFDGAPKAKRERHLRAIPNQRSKAS